MTEHPIQNIPSLAPLEDERLDAVNENLQLLQKKDGLTFGTDAYLLAAFLRSHPSDVGAELGGGTGIISLLALTKNKLQKVHVYEIQTAFASLCSRNGILNHLENRLVVHETDIRQMQGEQTLPLVFSNPPYMKADCGKENNSSAMNIARREICGTITDFCCAAGRLLKHGGLFVTVYRPERWSDLVCALREAQMEVKRVVWVYPSAEDKPCLVLTEAKKGASSGMVVARPLLIYKDSAKTMYTRDMEHIYETCSMDHLFA